MSPGFIEELRWGYADYQIHKMFDYGNGGLRYCKKVSFTDRSVVPSRADIMTLTVVNASCDQLLTVQGY